MKRLVWGAALALTLLAAGPAFAAEHKGWLGEHKTLIEQLTAVFNFAIFAYLLVKYAGPKVRAYFDGNAAEYRAKVDEAAKVLAEAKQVHAEWTARKAQLEQEAERMKADAVHLAEVQARDVVAAARQMAERIIKDAERTAEAELVRARDDLRAELAAAVLAKAEEKLRDRLTPSHHHVLIEEAIKKLEASQ